MKIVHISASNVGGAGNAAYRLHQGLLDRGISSKFLCKTKNKEKNTNQTLCINKIDNRYINKAKKLLGYTDNMLFGHDKAAAKIEGNYEIFTTPNTKFNIEDHKVVHESDIIHLHFTSNFLNWSSFFKKVNKPIIWTLHDMNPFMGGFHYLKDHKANAKNFFNIDSEYYRNKMEALQGVENITVVSPSKWLLQHSIKSDILGRFQHKYVPNCLDYSKYQIRERRMARQSFGLPEDENLFLFISKNVNNYRKGFDLLVEAAQRCISKYKFRIIVAGRLKKHIDGKLFLPIGHLNSGKEISMLYSAANATIIPSREDNLPNVLLESLACGTPVIASPTGGMKEIIETGKNGILSRELSVNSLSASIGEFLNGKLLFDSLEIRKSSMQIFDIPKVVNKYVDIYKKLI